MQLIPNRIFTVVRQIGNHTDTGTYYVRAIIRNAYTDEILATLDLEDKGGLRFKKDWRVPAETSGLGSFISIVTSVYVADDYVTKSENYSDEEHTYLWAELSSVVGSGGQGFSEKFDYRRIESIVAKGIATIPAPEPFPEIPTPKEYEMRWNDVLDAVERVRIAVEALPTENNDDAPIMKKLDEIAIAIESKEVTPATDLTPVLNKLSEDKDDNELNHDEAKEMIDSSTKKILDAIPKEMTKAIKKIKIVTATATHLSTDGKNTASSKDKMETEQEEEPEEEDPHILANSLTK